MSGDSAWVCGICQKSTAGFFCNCESSEVFLCEQCIGKHYTRLSARPHHCFPVAAFGDHKIPGYLERFTARAAAFAEKAENLRKSAGSIDQCMRKFNQKIDQLIGTIEEYRATTLQKLGTLKEDLSVRLENACKLVEDTLYADKDPSEDPIVKALRGSHEGQGKMRVFYYLLDDSRIKESLFSVLKYDITTYSQEAKEQLLPYICGNALCLIKSSGELIKTINLPVSFNLSSTTLVYIKNEVIFFEGGYHAKIFAMNLDSMGLTKAGSKLNDYSGPGVYSDELTIYLFGGRNSQVHFTVNAEKFIANSRTSISLPDMVNARASFNPVKYKSLLYLICGSTNIETFNLTTETFATLDISESLCSCSDLSFISNDELVVLDLRQSRQFRLNLIQSETSFRMFSLTCGGSCPGYTGELRGCVLEGKEQLIWLTSEGVTWRYNKAKNTIGRGHQISQEKAS